jgi:hypothetical protein
MKQGDINSYPVLSGEEETDDKQKYEKHIFCIHYDVFNDANYF